MQISCIGCTACAKLAPEIFTMSEKTGLAKMDGSDTIHPLVQKQDVEGKYAKQLLDCTEVCPTDSILIWDKDGKLLNKKELASYIRPARPYR